MDEFERTDRWDEEYDDVERVSSYRHRDPETVTRRRIAKMGHGLSVAPVVPLMVAGLGISGGGALGRQPSIVGLGFSLGAGAFAFSAVGGWLAYKNSGRPPRALPVYVVGLAFEGTGQLLYHLSMLGGSAGAQGTGGQNSAFPYAMAGAVALQITGMIVTSSSAKVSRDIDLDGPEEFSALPWFLASDRGVMLGVSGTL